jgi:hypothetical protein
MKCYDLLHLCAHVCVPIARPGELGIESSRSCRGAACAHRSRNLMALDQQPPRRPPPAPRAPCCRRLDAKSEASGLLNRKITGPGSFQNSVRVVNSANPDQ